MSVNSGYPRFRQSMALDVLDCPYLLERKLQGIRKTPSRGMCSGTVMHQAVLGGRAYQELDYPDYRTKEARTKRDAALEAGFTPILKHEARTCSEFAGEVRNYLETELGIDLEAARKEETIQWSHRLNDGAALDCEGTPDIVTASSGLIVDLKFGSGQGAEAMPRHIEAMGYHIQAAAYTEAVIDAAAEGITMPQYVLVCGDPETGGITHYELSRAFLVLGSADWHRACHAYAACCRANAWPYYPARVIEPEPKALARLIGGASVS